MTGVHTRRSEHRQRESNVKMQKIDHIGGEEEKLQRNQHLHLRLVASNAIR